MIKDKFSVMGGYSSKMEQQAKIIVELRDENRELKLENKYLRGNIK
ncbi:MAG: hypothetical protein LBT37_06410 [Lactobacillaceae bacterium]|jgi:hypothetical protein|nr:hypothetical protein [Lactobacillaceae bacterium]